MTSNQIPAREIYWNLPPEITSLVMYLLFAVAMVVCTYGLYSRLRLWASGTPDSSRFGNYFARFAYIWDYVLKQRGVNREPGPRGFHSLIFWGFNVLLLTTTVVAIDYDLHIPIYRGNFYLALTVLSDLFGFGVLLGVLMAFRRRYVAKPDLIHRTRADGWMLGGIAALIVQGFVLEGIRIAVTHDQWAAYSPIGYAVAQLLNGVSEAPLRAIHRGMWWFHAASVFTFIAILPYSKALHIITASANLYFKQNGRPTGALSYPGDIEQLIEKSAESDGEFKIGITNILDLTWKQRLDLDACTTCGRCQDVCPAYKSGKALSPKWLVLDTRDHMLSLQAQGKLEANGSPLAKLDRSLLQHLLLDTSHGPEENGAAPDYVRAANPRVQAARLAVGGSAEAKLSGEVMDSEVFWACTTCRACEEACPVGIEHVGLIVNTRRASALLEGDIPTEAQASLRAIETRGNPFGPAESRMDWAAGLNVPIVKAGETVDVLYWVGCISAYDRRKQSIARALVEVLNKSGLSWGVLGTRENCTGDPARRLGEENLFQTMAKKNIEVLASVNFKTLLANCPHCFHTLKNEYPDVGLKLDQARIVHHSQFLKELLANEQLQLKDGADRNVTFHDPCYLGRYNEEYDAPRDVLVQLNSSSKAPAEMANAKKKGLCCGAGGGHFWFDMKVGERVNVLRINQAAETGASTVATACPFCMHMLEDGAKLTDREATLQVRDIAELVVEKLA